MSQLHAHCEGFSSATEQEITKRVPDAACVLVVDGKGKVTAFPVAEMALHQRGGQISGSGEVDRGPADHRPHHAGPREPPLHLDHLWYRYLLLPSPSLSAESGLIETPLSMRDGEGPF
ncbi:MAG: hypothetical protein ACREA0_17930, partial [bacterium]